MPLSGTIPLGEIFPSVPSMAVEAQDFVEGLLSDSRAAAQTLVEQARTAITDLQVPVASIDLPAPPAPVDPLTVIPGGSFQVGVTGSPDFGDITQQIQTGQFTPDTITIPDLTSAIPEYVQLVTGLNLPEAPEPGVFVMPTAPVVSTDLTVPDAPTPDYGDIPDLYALDLPTYTAPTLAPFSHVAPTFDATISEAGVSWVEPTYVGQMATTLKATLAVLLAGGTGIDPTVENAIWERDRARIVRQSNADRAKLATEWERKGFTLPQGVLYAAQAAADMDAAFKIAAASRDTAIKQAELEQKNRQFAVTEGRELESLYVQIFLGVTERSFQIAKYAVEARIAIFNALVAKYNTDAAVFGQRITQYRVELEYVQAQILAFKELVAAEGVKAEVNKSLISAFGEKVRAFSSQADAYGSLVKAVVARSELQKNQVDVYRAQIEGVTAQIGAKKQEFDGYSARVGAEAQKANLEDANSRAYSARVNAITAAAGITVKQAEVQMQSSELRLRYQIAELQRMGELASEQLRAIQARAAIYEANTRLAIATQESAIKGKELEITGVVETNKAQIANYTVQIEQWKASVAAIEKFAELQMEAMKAAGQIAATMAAGAYAGTSVAASFNGSVSRSEANSQTQGYSETHNESESSINSVSNSTSTVYQHNISE
jgi:hypothetical protein